MQSPSHRRPEGTLPRADRPHQPRDHPGAEHHLSVGHQGGAHDHHRPPASGAVERYDSGWQAASDGLFNFPDGTGITRDQIHSGLIDGVINVHNIQQVGLPITSRGPRTSPDTTPLDRCPSDEPTPVEAPTIGDVPTQLVTFDADVIISTQHNVMQGASNQRDLNGVTSCLRSVQGITGFIGLAFDYHLSLPDMAASPRSSLGRAARSTRSSTLAGGQPLSRYGVRRVSDPRHGHQRPWPSSPPCAASRSSRPMAAWSVAVRTAAQDAPVSLGANQATPRGATECGQRRRESHPLRGPCRHLPPGARLSNLPATAYGFLQATATQSNFSPARSLR